MGKLLIRLVINVIALYVAIFLLRGHGIDPQTTNWLSFIWLALIFGLVNAVIRPILKFITCPLIILTLGLGTLLINTAMFALAGAIGTHFGVGFIVEGFWPAFFGALIVSVVSMILSVFINDKKA